MVPSLIITTWLVSLASATNQNIRKTLGPGSKNYYQELILMVTRQVNMASSLIITTW